MQQTITRREMVKGTLIAGALVPSIALIGKVGEAAPALTPLDANDPTAKALGFVTDASKAASNPVYKAGSKCSNCSNYEGKPSDASGACKIFVGHTVPSLGWCASWVAKPA